MANIGWGKPRIFIRDLEDGDGASWIELPTPVENTTTLATSKGDKQEAKIEGGENEDVRYNRNTYALSLELRAVKDREKPIEDSDGIVDHKYEVMLQPEDPTVDGFHIPQATVSVEDNWDSEDGGSWVYTFDALKKDKDTNQLIWGVVTATPSTGTVTNVEIAAQ